MTNAWGLDTDRDTARFEADMMGYDTVSAAEEFYANESVTGCDLDGLAEHDARVAGNVEETDAERTAREDAEVAEWSAHLAETWVDPAEQA